MSVYYRDKNGDDNLISGMAPITNNITDGDMAAVTSNAVADALANKQNKTDNNLTTTSKTTTGAINELNSALTKHTLTTDYIDIASYNSSDNKFTCPSDGYILVQSSTGIISLLNEVEINMLSVGDMRGSIYVKKGMKFHIIGGSSPTARFYSLS